jgi:hypothetical protein
VKSQASGKANFPLGFFEKCEENFQDNEKSIFAWERTFIRVCLKTFNINRISLKEKRKECRSTEEKNC